MVHEVNEKAENQRKNTVAVNLPDVPEKTHLKIKKHRARLIKKRGELVTIVEAYYDYLDKAKV